MAVYAYDPDTGALIDKATGDPMLTDGERKAPPELPMIWGFKAYACPITGKEIRTLGQHNANLKKHGCIEAAELGSPTGGKIRNERFARKHGLEVSDQYKDQPWKPKEKA